MKVNRRAMIVGLAALGIQVSTGAPGTRLSSPMPIRRPPSARTIANDGLSVGDLDRFVRAPSLWWRYGAEIDSEGVIIPPDAPGDLYLEQIQIAADPGPATVTMYTAPGIQLAPQFWVPASSCLTMDGDQIPALQLDGGLLVKTTSHVRVVVGGRVF